MIKKNLKLIEFHKSILKARIHVTRRRVLVDTKVQKL